MATTATTRYMCKTETYIRPIYIELPNAALENAIQSLLASYEGATWIRRYGLRKATDLARVQALCTACSDKECVPVSRYSSTITVVTE